MTSAQVEGHLLNRTEKRLQNDLKKLEKQTKEKQLQLDGIQKQKEVQREPSPNVTITEIPSNSTNLLLLPPSTGTLPQDQPTVNQPFTIPQGASPPSSFVIGDIIAFGYPYYSLTPAWKIGKIIGVGQTTINVMVSSSPTGKKGFLFYKFVQGGETISISKNSVVSSVRLNAHGSINLRAKSSSFLTTLGLVKQ